MQEHEGKEAQHLGFVRHKLAQDPRKADSFGAQLTTQQLITGGGAVTFVEDEIEHCQDRIEAVRKLVRRGNAIGDVRLTDLAFHPDQALRHGRLRHEERSRDLQRG